MKKTIAWKESKDMTDVHYGIGVTIWALSIPFLTGILVTLVAFALVTRW